MPDIVLSADKGVTINAIVLQLQKMLLDPELKLSFAKAAEVKSLVVNAQTLISEVTGARFNIPNLFTDIVDENNVALLNSVTKSLQVNAVRKLGDRFDRIEVVMDRVATNVVTLREYDIFMIAHLRNGTMYYGGVNDKGHHVFADTSIWDELRVKTRS